MSDPPRLLERGDGGLAVTLLRAGSEERPSSESMRRTLLAVGVSTIASTAAAGGSTVLAGVAGSTAKIGASSISVALVAKWVAIGSISGLVTMGAATELAGPRLDEQPMRPPAAAISPPVRRVASAPHRSPLERSLVADGEGVETGTERPAVGSESNANAPAKEPPPDRADPLARPVPLTALPLVAAAEAWTGRADRAEVPSTGDVASISTWPPSAASSQGEGAMAGEGGPRAAEAPKLDDPAPRGGASELSLRLNNQVMLIDGAWAAMKRNDPAIALRALSDYERAYPALELHPEVLFLRLNAHEALGQRLAARAEANRIVALYPQSAQAKRAHALLERR